MAIVTLTFTKPINASVQIGDVVLYSNPTTVGNFSTSAQSDVIYLGTVTTVGVTLSNGSQTRLQMNVDYNSVTTAPPSIISFIFFSKDKIVNPSGVIGYFAEVCFKNDSTIESELFAINADVFESSK